MNYLKLFWLLFGFYVFTHLISFINTFKFFRIVDIDNAIIFYPLYFLDNILQIPRQIVAFPVQILELFSISWLGAIVISQLVVLLRDLLILVLVLKLFGVAFQNNYHYKRYKIAIFAFILIFNPITSNSIYHVGSLPAKLILQGMDKFVSYKYFLAIKSFEKSNLKLNVVSVREIKASTYASDKYNYYVVNIRIENFPSSVPNLIINIFNQDTLENSYFNSIRIENKEGKLKFYDVRTGEILDSVKTNEVLLEVWTDKKSVNPELTWSQFLPTLKPVPVDVFVDVPPHEYFYASSSTKQGGILKIK